jgi:cobalt-zinc-cadmium efflux system protein
VAISIWIFIEAGRRLGDPPDVEGGLMLGVAAAGLAVNAASAWVLRPDAESSLNLRGAYLHILGDLLGSVGTVAAALIVRYTGWLPVDPLASALVTLVIVRGAWRLVRESVDVLLESTPAHIPLAAVRAQLEAIPGVERVHDLHVWSVTSSMVAMSAHAIVREPQRHQHVLEHVHDAMRLFGIQHVTVQLEREEMFDRELHLHP